MSEQGYSIMLVLGIETSCDETAAALVVDGREILSNIIATQFDLLNKYGGVVPEVAARRHTELIGYIVEEALDKAGKTLSDINAVAVSSKQGLIGCQGLINQGKFQRIAFG